MKKNENQTLKEMFKSRDQTEDPMVCDKCGINLTNKAKFLIHQKYCRGLK